MPAYVEHVPGLRWTKMILTVRVGHLDDPIGQEGTAHMLEHHVNTCGPSGYGLAGYDKMLDWLSFYANEAERGSTSADYTRYSIKSLNDGFGKASRLLHDLVFYPEFGVGDIAHDRAIIARERATRNRSLISERMSTLFQGHRLATMNGCPADSILEKITEGDLIAMHQRFYHYRNAFLVVATGLPLQHCLKWLNEACHLKAKQYGEPRLATPEYAIPESARFHHRTMTDVQAPAAKTEIAIHYLLPVNKRTETKLFSNMVKQAIQSTVREQERLIYDAASNIEAFSVLRTVTLETITKPADRDRVITRLTEIARDPEVVRHLFARMCQEIEHALLLSEETTSGTLERVWWSAYFGEQPENLDDIARSYRKLQREDILALQSEHFHPKRGFVITRELY